MNLPLLPLLFACADASDLPPPLSQAPTGFWDHWGDGRAELSGYTVRQPRYGALRPGEAVLIVVTEEFTAASRVKSDGAHADKFPVVKLNYALDFQTGVYDYNTMASVFARLDGKDPVGVPTKISFSSQEWCGHVYDQVITHGTRYDRSSHSYFDGEADQDQSLAIPVGAVFLDAMPLVVRGLTSPLAAAGESRTVQLHDRLADLRFEHRPASWRSATYSVGRKPVSVTVPMGTFQATVHTLVAGSDTWTWAVDVAPPHRLVRWTGPGGEEGLLRNSTRQPYWNQSGFGAESGRQALGLDAPTWTRTP